MLMGKESELRGSILCYSSCRNVFFLIEACGQTTLEVNCRARRNAFVKTIKPMSWWQAYINRFLVIDTSELTATVLSDAEPDAMPRDVIVAKRPGLGARG